MYPQLNQPDYGPLFAHKARSRHDDPPTSRRAAKRYDGSGLRQTHAQAIVAAVRATPGLNTHKLATATGLHVTQVDRRAIELERAGLVRRVDEGEESLCWYPGGAV